jgi:hypothetical protein
MIFYLVVLLGLAASLVLFFVPDLIFRGDRSDDLRQRKGPEDE